MHYFFFGTLMDPDLLETVLGRRLPGAAFELAELDGYRAVAAADEDYPVLVADSNSTVGGIVVRGLGEADTRRIAFFEESEYTVTVRRVRLTGTDQMADAIVHLTSSLQGYHDIRWDFATWQRINKPLLLVLSRQWMQHFTSDDLAAAEAEWDATRAQWLAGDVPRWHRAR